MRIGSPVTVDSPRRPGEPKSWHDLSYWTTRGFWAIVDQALFALSNLLVNVLLARWLSPREYGAFVTAYVVLVLVTVAYSGLLIEPMMVLGPRRFGEGRAFKDYFAFLLRFQWSFGAAAALTLLLIGAAAYGFGADLGSTFVGLACAAPFILLSWLARRACYVERQPAIAALGGAVYLLVAGTGAVLLYRLGVLTSMWAQLLMGIAAIASSGVILKKLGQKWLPPPAAIDTRSLLKEHWTFLRWSGGAGALSFAQGMAFYLVLPVFGGLEVSAALRAMNNFVMPVLQSDGALAVLIAPELARARNRPHDLSRIVRWSTWFFAIEGVICWLLLAVFRHDLVRFAYGDRYTAYADLLLVLGAVPLLASRGNMLSALLRVHMRVRQAFWSNAVGAGISLALGLATLARYGAYAVVVATIVAEIVRLGIMASLLTKPGADDPPNADASLVGPPQPSPVLESRS
jgi:O-antigen/teichoic acid export membrane protein